MIAGKDKNRIADIQSEQDAYRQDKGSFSVLASTRPGKAEEMDRF